MKRLRMLLLLVLVGGMLLAEDKLVGGDISMLPSYESAGVKYLDAGGKQIGDMIEYFKDEAGFNVARVRLFVSPTGETGVVQNLEYVLPLCQRIKSAGMKLLFDFHYSDTWADPSNQWTPTLWVDLTQEELKQRIYEYTKDVLEQLTKAGAAPDYIQTGNEISYGMLWGKQGTRTYYCHYDKDQNWDRLVDLLSEAGKACREVCADAKIIIHTERTNNWVGTQKIYQRLSELDYDIIGLSYYPEWHNNLSSLKSVLNNLKSAFPTKQVMIVETGYYNNWYPTNATYDFTSVWPASAAGQKKFLDELVEAVRDMDHVLGIVYWFPEENPYNNRVYEPWYNHGLFNPNTGKVSEGLFSLMSLRGLSTDVQGVKCAEYMNDMPIYSIDGRQVGNKADLPCGVYIQGGKKMVIGAGK